MRAVLTGAAGFVGSHVARALVARGDEVLAIVRPSTPRDRIADIESALRIAALDLTDTASLARALGDFRPEAVIHLAWYAHPSDYLRSEANLASLAASVGLVRLARDAGCPKFVGAGTCIEYARSDRPRRETDPTGPENLYAACKLAASLVADALGRQAGMEVTWARLFHIVGPDEHPDRLLPQVTAALAAGRPFELSPGDQVRDFLHVDDVASALVALTSPGRSGVFNVCSGEGVTLGQLLSEVGNRLGRPDLLRFGARPYRSDEELVVLGDPARLWQTGWAPRYPWREAIGDVLARTTVLR